MRCRLKANLKVILSAMGVVALQLTSVVGVEGYRIDQRIGTGGQSAAQFDWLFAVKNDDLRTALNQVVWQRTVATMGNCLPTRCGRRESEKRISRSARSDGCCERIACPSHPGRPLAELRNIPPAP
jgi:hypothetical protein